MLSSHSLETAENNCKVKDKIPGFVWYQERYSNDRAVSLAAAGYRAFFLSFQHHPRRYFLTRNSCLIVFAAWHIVLLHSDQVPISPLIYKYYRCLYRVLSRESLKQLMLVIADMDAADNRI